MHPLLFALAARAPPPAALLRRSLPAMPAVAPALLRRSVPAMVLDDGPTLSLCLSYSGQLAQ
eukprot:7329530-Prymnesium_polylepis.1